jgi:subtilisin family serine protease
MWANEVVGVPTEGLTMKVRSKLLVSPLLCVAAASSPLSAETYVLSAASWGQKQVAAVRAAGGAVTFSHPDAGLAVVESASPAFLARALASGAFVEGAADQRIPWVPPTPTQVLEPEGAVTPDPLFWYQWNMRAIEADLAWAQGCTGKGVRVGVLDGGISRDHLDIAPNLDTAASASFVPGKAYWEDVDDDYTDGDGPFRHATHVAGIVAAPDNGMGVTGVAPEATIVAVKVLDGGSGYFSWVIRGILYAATPRPAGGGVDVINMSLSGVFAKAGGGGPLVSALNRAVNYATRRGTLVVSAAGNDAFNFDHSGSYTVVPAESGNGIAVSATGPVGYAYGATDFRDPASYTNYGQSVVFVAAPGGDFRLLGRDDYWYLDMVLSPSYAIGDSHYYSFAAGTSMAAPAAAGVAAIIEQRFPGISVGALKNRLATSADDEGKSGHDAFYGRGFVNAYKACTAR